MFRSLALGAWEILLRGVLLLRVGAGGRGRLGRRGLAGEEALENALCLPLGRVGEVDPDVHASRAAQSGIKALDMIRSGEEEARVGRGLLSTMITITSARGVERLPSFRCSHTI